MKYKITLIYTVPLGHNLGGDTVANMLEDFFTNPEAGEEMKVVSVERDDSEAK